MSTALFGPTCRPRRGIGRESALRRGTPPSLAAPTLAGFRTFGVSRVSSGGPVPRRNSRSILDRPDSRPRLRPGKGGTVFFRNVGALFGHHSHCVSPELTSQMGVPPRRQNQSGWGKTAALFAVRQAVTHVGYPSNSVRRTTRLPSAAVSSPRAGVGSDGVSDGIAEAAPVLQCRLPSFPLSAACARERVIAPA